MTGAHWLAKSGLLTAVGPLDIGPDSRENCAMNALLSRITIDPSICHGEPVIRGLRYPVESLLEYLAGGDSIDDVVAEFPDLQREDLLACIEFATLSLKLKSQHLVVA